MIILESEAQLIHARDVLKDLNRAPRNGDSGHTLDHKILADAMLNIPSSGMMYGQVIKMDGIWYKFLPGPITDWSDDFSPQEITFAEVLEMGETPGLVFIAGNPYPFADGITDYKEDIFPDEIGLMLYPAGVFGLETIVTLLNREVVSLRSRIVALEAKIPE